MNKQLDDESTKTMMILLFLAPMLLGVAAKYLTSVEVKLLEMGVLTRENVIIYLGESGLDFYRIVPLVATLLIAAIWVRWNARAKGDDG